MCHSLQDIRLLTPTIQTHLPLSTAPFLGFFSSSFSPQERLIPTPHSTAGSNFGSARSTSGRLTPTPPHSNASSVAAAATAAARPAAPGGVRRLNSASHYTASSVFASLRSGFAAEGAETPGNFSDSSSDVDSIWRQQERERTQNPNRNQSWEQNQNQTREQNPNRNHEQEHEPEQEQEERSALSLGPPRRHREVGASMAAAPSFESFGSGGLPSLMSMPSMNSMLSASSPSPPFSFSSLVVLGNDNADDGAGDGAGAGAGGREVERQSMRTVSASTITSGTCSAGNEVSGFRRRRRRRCCRCCYFPVHVLVRTPAGCLPVRSIQLTVPPSLNVSRVMDGVAAVLALGLFCLLQWSQECLPFF